MAAQLRRASLALAEKLMGKSNDATSDTLFDSVFDGRDAEKVINLIVGAPGFDTLRRVTPLFADACTHRAAHAAQNTPEGNGAIFQYGPRLGYRPFREQLAAFLTANYGEPVDAASLLETAGATIGLWLAATALMQKSAVVFVECPTYFIALDVLQKDLGYRPVFVPMEDDGSGVDVDAFETAVKREYEKRSSKDKKGFWAMFYTVPTFHNPTGAVLSPAKSRRVVDVARKYDVLVVCDDVYNLLYYGNKAEMPRRLYAYDDKDDPDYGGGHVISNGSFSKILGPGFRVGWLEMPARLIETVKECGVILSGGSLNNVVGGIIASAIELGQAQGHLEFLREEYSKRMEAFTHTLEKLLPKGFKVRTPNGGYFTWVSTDDDHFDAGDFAKWCLKEHDVQVLPGERCGPKESSSSPSEMLSAVKKSFRVSIAFYPAPRLVEGAKRLGEALSQYQKMEK